MAEIGDNSNLKSFINRIEEREAEKAEIADDIRAIYAEAKSSGFDPKIMRKIIRIRKQDAEERAAEEALIETYMAALGMLADTPLGQAAIARVSA